MVVGARLAQGQGAGGERMSISLRSKWHEIAIEGTPKPSQVVYVYHAVHRAILAVWDGVAWHRASWDGNAWVAGDVLGSITHWHDAK